MSRLPWVREPDPPHPLSSFGTSSQAYVDVPGAVFVSAHGCTRSGYMWHVRTYHTDRAENGHAYGEASTMDRAMRDAEVAALPLIDRMIAERERECAKIRALLG